jgi:hypothetical protein
MSSQQLQSSKLKMTSQNLRPLAPKPLTPKFLGTIPLVPKPLVPKRTPLAPKSLRTTPLAPKPLAPKRTPLASKPLKSMPIPLLQDQNFSNEMENSNLFTEYKANALMLPNEESSYYSLQENNQENYFYEEGIPLDILNVERESFNVENVEGLAVSIKF